MCCCWSRANLSFYFACILLCSARAVHRCHNARLLALETEDNGIASVPDMCRTNQVSQHYWNQGCTDKECFVGFDQRKQYEHVDLNAGQRNKEVTVCSSAPEGPWGHSLYALIDQLSETVLWRNHQREPRHTLPQMGSSVRSSEYGVQFQKCAQVVKESEFPQVSINLVVKNLEDGTDLSQLSIRDTVSDIINLQTNGKMQDRDFQTFSMDTLPAGSSYAVSYTAIVRGRSINEDLFLPAFLTFSSTSQNDIYLFRPVVANFTLRINTTEKVCVNHALHFAGFCVAFLISTLLLSLTLLTASCVYKKYLMRAPQYNKRRSLSVEAGPEVAVCNTSDTANEDAAFENRIIDIMALEDPQDMTQALDDLEMSSLLRGTVMVECVRVQMLKGVFRLLTAKVCGSSNEVSMVDLFSHVTDMQEDQKSQLNTHSTIEARTERQNVEQLRLEALHRREELHFVISEEIEEAAMTGGTHLANELLHKYYSCQDQLESVLDLFIANQRAALSEQQAQRRFLLQGLQDLQRSMCDMFGAFSRHIDSWFTRIRREGVLSDQHCAQQFQHAYSELQRVQKCFEETLVRERISARCDLIKMRRARIAEMLCEQKREQQDLVCGSVCDVPLEDYLMRWQTLLCAHNTHLSELITHLDQEAAARMRRVLVCVLRDAVADLKQVECETSESLQEAGVPRWLLLQMKAGSVVGGCLADTEAELGVRKREAAKTLRLARSRIQTIREQEVQHQRERRERMHTYYRSVWESQFSLSESDLLRMQLEYVKSVCHLDRCLVLPRLIPRKKECSTLTNQSTQQPLDHTSNEPCAIFTHAQVCVCKDGLCVCEDEMSKCEDRMMMQVAAVQWDKVERKSRVLETHTALLTLQTLLMQTVSHAPVVEELSHAIHTQSLSLEEAELLLQKEESEWERSMDGLGHNKLLTPEEEDLFQVNTECVITECLQEALYKRQQLTHTFTERLRMEIRRQQLMEDLREQQELKRLYTHFEQDLLLVALLVKLGGVSEPVLQQLLCLLLPTQPEREQQSLIHTLAPKEGRILGPCYHLVDRLRNDIISKHMSPCSRAHTDRMLKKKQKLVEKLFSRSQKDSEHNPLPANSQPITVPATQKEEASNVVGETMMEMVKCTGHPGENEVAADSETAKERLFTVRCASGDDLEHTHPGHTTHTAHMSPSHKKRKKFKFKKGTVAPQEQT